MKFPRILVILGRICRHAPQFVVWFVVGMVCFHGVLRVMGVSWYDISLFWLYVGSGFVGSTMMEKFLARRRRNREAEEQRLEDEAQSLVDEEKRWLKRKRTTRGRNLDS